jgi:hypothetical protein
VSLIDPSLFKGEPEAGGGSPFGAYAKAPPPTGVGFKDARVLTVVMSVLMVIGMMANLAFVVASQNPDPEDVGYGFAALTFFAFSLAGFIAMMVWFYRATKNARAISNGVETRPGWAVAYFFIPVISLFRPYRTMSEIWRSAHSPLSWKGLHDPITLRLWWGGWLAGAIGGMVGGLAEPAGGPITWLSTLVGIAADILFLYLARRVAVAQVANKDQSVFD